MYIHKQQTHLQQGSSALCMDSDCFKKNVFFRLQLSFYSIGPLKIRLSVHSYVLYTCSGVEVAVCRVTLELCIILQGSAGYTGLVQGIV